MLAKKRRSDDDRNVKAKEGEELRRSSRLRKPTERMFTFQREEAQNREKRVLQLYVQWKGDARKAREQIKSDIPETQIVALIDMLEKRRDDIADIYVEIRDRLAPSNEMRRRIDGCEAVTVTMDPQFLQVDTPLAAPVNTL